MRKKKKTENTIKSKSRRNFLLGLAGTAVTISGYTAIKTAEHWPQIKREWRRMNPPKPEVDLKKLDEVPSETHRNIKIHGFRRNERAAIKDTIDFMHDMHNSLASVGIFYRDSIDKLQTFSESQKPIVIDKNLAETRDAGALYNGIGITQPSAITVDNENIRKDTKAPLASSLYHEMVHNDEDSINSLVSSTAGYSEEKIKRYDMESEIYTNTSDAEYEALAYIAERISEGKTKSNDARQIANEAIKELPKLCPAKELNDYGKLKQDATIAALRKISDKGPASVASMETKVAAYNVIRGHVKGENFPDIPPQTIYRAYAKQNEKTWKNYSQRNAGRDTTSLAPPPPIEEKIKLLYKRDTRGSLLDKTGIAHPLFSDENKRLFHKDEVDKMKNPEGHDEKSKTGHKNIVRKTGEPSIIDMFKNIETNSK